MKKKLSKLNFKFEIGIFKALEEMNLKVISLSNRYNVFEAIVSYFFKNKKQANKLKMICSNFLEKCRISGQFPEELEFLNEKDILNIYYSKQHHQFFEGFNLNLISHLFNRKIRLFSVQGENRMLNLTNFNYKANPTLNLLSMKVKDKLFYFPLEEINFQLSEKEKKKRRKNFGKIKKFIEERQVNKDNLGTGIDNMKLLKQINTDHLREKMNSIGNFTKLMSSFQNNKNNIGSSIREINYLFKGKELQNLEKLEGSTKKNVIFGEQTTIKFFKKRVKKKKTFRQYTGKVNSFNKDKGYGFLQWEGKSLFFHADKKLQELVEKNQNGLFSFFVQDYVSKGKKSSKAVKIKLIDQLYLI